MLGVIYYIVRVIKIVENKIKIIVHFLKLALANNVKCFLKTINMTKQ